MAESDTEVLESMDERAVMELKLSDREDRQEEIASWARRAFGDDEAQSLRQRAMRLLEEATEAAQSVELTEAECLKVISHVYKKPPGLLYQELGGVGVCVLALAAAAGLGADRCELLECSRVLTKSLEHFRERNAAKNNAGLKA